MQSNEQRESERGNNCMVPMTYSSYRVIYVISVNFAQESIVCDVL